jgi:RNA-binding proteins (RRM domain)
MELFVSNFSLKTSEKDLTRLFSEYGYCRVRLLVSLLKLINKYQGAYGFVRFENEENAARALRKLNGERFQGRRLRVEWSHESKKELVIRKHKSKYWLVCCYLCCRNSSRRNSKSPDSR